MLKVKTLEKLQNKKNLLAFSGGVDSSALLFLLLAHDIKFDIVIVDYEVRAQSKEEVAYAKELALTYNFTCHHYQAPKIEKNFEAHAREIRYNFFQKILHERAYDNLLTAHHLGDRFEWMLMQFCKGAGCVELAGMRESEARDGYTLIRPLLHLEKKELLEYLHLHERKYFLDASNNDQSIKRNYFRHNYTLALMRENLAGIKKSFAYIDEDFDLLIEKIEIKKIKDFAYFRSSKKSRSDIYALDKYLKEQGYMPSASERELLKEESTLVLGRKFLVSWCRELICITPFIQSKTVLPKEFKEICRKLQIEPKMRPYLYKNSEAFLTLQALLERF